MVFPRRAWEPDSHFSRPQGVALPPPPQSTAGKPDPTSASQKAVRSSDRPLLRQRRGQFVRRLMSLAPISRCPHLRQSKKSHLSFRRIRRPAPSSIVGEAETEKSDQKERFLPAVEMTWVLISQPRGLLPKTAGGQHRLYLLRCRIQHLTDLAQDEIWAVGFLYELFRP